ncbi:chloroplastic/amyloplastic,Starch synthase 3 [Trichinella spiralis]|uniref:Chloroplastic/amyloplastic,Starch synthase 3 n=1 Tax=Trichinella spiralis TaxID=6334 RepID=A0ABR3KEM1_TRISP
MILLLLLSLTASLQCNGAKNESEIENHSEFQVKFAFCSFKVCEKELSNVEKPNLTEEEVKTYYELYTSCRDACFEKILTSETFAKKFEKFKLKEYEKLMKQRQEKEEKRKEKRRKEAEKKKKKTEKEEKKKEKQQKEPTEFEVKFAFCSFKVCEKELRNAEKPNLTEQEAKTYYELYMGCRDACFEKISTSESFAKKFEKFKLKEYEKLMKKRQEKEEKRKEKRRKEAEKIKKQKEREEEKKRKLVKTETVLFAKVLEKQEMKE